MTNRLVAYGCLALSMSLVGSYVALSKPLVAVIPVFLLAWLRFGIGGLAMLHWLKKPADEAPLTPQTQRLLFLESFLGNFLFSICMLFGVGLTSAVSAGVIMAAIPAVVALMSWAFLRERISTRVWLAVGCAAVGIGLLALSKYELSEQSLQGLGTNLSSNARATVIAGISDMWLGNLLVFGAVLCEAAYVVIGKRLTGVMSPKRISSLVNLWGFALVTPFGLYVAWQFDFASVSAPLWSLLVFYALAASVWTVWLWMTGLKNIPASQSGVFTVMLPVSAALVGVLVLDERLTGAKMLALSVALAGVVLATLPGGKRGH